MTKIPKNKLKNGQKLWNMATMRSLGSSFDDHFQDMRQGWTELTSLMIFQVANEKGHHRNMKIWSSFLQKDQFKITGKWPGILSTMWTGLNQVTSYSKMVTSAKSRPKGAREIILLPHRGHIWPLFGLSNYFTLLLLPNFNLHNPNLIKTYQIHYEIHGMGLNLMEGNDFWTVDQNHFDEISKMNDREASQDRF